MKKLLFILMITAFAGNAFSQGNMPADRASFYRFGNLFMTDVFPQASAAKDSLQITVFFKAGYDALVFVQNPQDQTFSTVLQFEAAFRDNTGIIRRRIGNIDTIRVDTFEKTKDKESYHIGFVSAVLPVSDYSVLSVYSDARNQVLHRNTIEIPQSGKFSTSPKLLFPIFSGKTPNGWKLYQLQRSVPFSSEPISIFVAASSKNESAIYSYSISQKEDKNRINWGVFSGSSGNAKFLQNAELEFNHLRDIYININNKERTNSEMNFGVVQVDLHGNSFFPGSYELTLINLAENDTAKYDFNVVWESMPLALRNPEYALKTMEYILTDDEIRQISSGSRGQLMNRIVEYWRKSDPTPNTPYNEAMAEYFRRVDHAFFNFQTLAEKDGALTDRGMVYILYGPPEIVRTSLVEGKTREIWVYSRIIKEFTFEMISSGVFKLSDIKE